MVRVFDNVNQLQTSLIFAGKAGAYLSGGYTQMEGS
jgi:hypothetical protein